MPPHANVEHRRQEEPSGCLAACVQMALLAMGIERSQRELNRLLGLTDLGVPASNVQRLSNYGLTVEYGRGDELLLQTAIDQQSYPIVFLQTGNLPYWEVNLQHAVLVVGYQADHILLNDPAFSTASIEVSWGNFLLAWSEFDYRYALIRRSL